MSLRRFSNAPDSRELLVELAKGVAAYMAFIVSMRLSLVLGMAFLEKPTIMERFAQLIPLRYTFAALAWTIEEACETARRTTLIPG